jgi:hypothetical protein
MKRNLILIINTIIILCSACKKDVEPVVDIPVVTTGDATVCGNTSVKVYLDVSGNNYSDCGIILGTNISLTSYDKYSCSSYTAVTDLKCNTRYYYRAYASDTYGNVTYGGVSLFTTKNLSATVTTVEATNKGYNSNYDYPYRFSVSASLVGSDKVSEWGIMVSSYSSFSSYSYDDISYSSYIEGESRTQSWGSKSSGVRYCRTYAVLTDGSYIYGSTKAVTLSK